MIASMFWIASANLVHAGFLLVGGGHDAVPPARLPYAVRKSPIVA